MLDQAIMADQAISSVPVFGAASDSTSVAIPEGPMVDRSQNTLEQQPSLPLPFPEEDASQVDLGHHDIRMITSTTTKMNDDRDETKEESSSTSLHETNTSPPACDHALDPNAAPAEPLVQPLSPRTTPLHDDTSDLLAPKPRLASPASLSPSPPDSPTSTIRSLTPPFPDEPENRLVEKPAIVFPSISIDINTSPYLAPSSSEDKRRHSSAALSPTADVGGLQPPVPFLEFRRYSLVDSGPISSLGRRTQSEVGLNTLANNADGVARPRPRPSTQTAPRPASARFSTFAEMGIQSFAMAKGEKTVDATKLKKSPLRNGHSSRTSSLTNILTKKGSSETPRTSGSGDREGELGLGLGEGSGMRKLEVPGAETQESDPGKAKGLRKRKKSAMGMQRDCIIM